MTLLRRCLGPQAVLVALIGVSVLLAGIAYAGWSVAAEDERAPAAARRPALALGAGTVAGQLVPGGAVTGSAVVRSPSGPAVGLTSARLGPATSPVAGCADAAVFALTVEPTPATPLVLPRGPSTTPLGWTAFMTEQAPDRCQGARLSSDLVLDGTRVGRVSAVAATLPAPGRPVGGPTTPSRAAVRWSAAPGAHGYLVERAPSGTVEWQPACGSAAAPLAATTCVDTGLAAETAYAYRVTAVRGAWRRTGPFSADVLTQPDC